MECERQFERRSREIRATLADAACRASGCGVRFAWNAGFIMTIGLFAVELLSGAGEGSDLYMLVLGPAVVAAVVLLFFSNRLREQILRFTWWKAVLVTLVWFVPRPTHVDHGYSSPFGTVIGLIRDLF